MTPEQILSQFEYAVIFFLAVLVAVKFYQTKDGYLRKLLIWYFISVAWSFGGEWIYYMLYDIGYAGGFNIVFMHIICHMPKAVAMWYLYQWLSKPGR